jgi:hypothetical protein
VIASFRCAEKFDVIEVFHHGVWKRVVSWSKVEDVGHEAVGPVDTGGGEKLVKLITGGADEGGALACLLFAPGFADKNNFVSHHFFPSAAARAS